MGAQKIYAIKIGKKRHMIANSEDEYRAIKARYPYAKSKTFFSDGDARKWLKLPPKKDITLFNDFAKIKVYAILHGKKDNIITSNYKTCEELVLHVSNAKYKSFMSFDEATTWLLKNNNGEKIRIMK